MMKSMNLLILFIISFSLINIMINSLISNYKMIHPLIMGTNLMLFNIFVSLNMSMFNNNNWFSYITFLIIVGGMMVLFLYFTSFIMNMNTSLKPNFLMNMNLKMMMILIMMNFMLMFLNKFMIWYNKNNEIISINSMMNMNLFNKNYYIMYMYMYNKNIISILSILYLLLSLTLIVKMIMMNKYTLRKIN
uniref:NADH dehydrogenase subunit 6 n=1 Tax=Metaphycus eriococci TaxID=2498640 RepID=A0A7T3U727_9HYME|nr:NADH dehydrogenase subunit 6 [Metaphycus eriococci]QPZ53233.1 NADH dehydrogenase subunit 6 [Metaphycus eriococci]